MKINETSLEHFLLFACRLIKRQSKSGPQLGSRIAWNKGEMETNIQRMPRVHQNQEQHQNRQDTNCRHRDPQISRFPSLSDPQSSPFGSPKSKNGAAEDRTCSGDSLSTCLCVSFAPENEKSDKCINIYTKYLRLGGPGSGVTAISPPLNEMLTIFIGKITSVTSPGGKTADASPEPELTISVFSFRSALLQQKENYVNAGKLFRPQPGNFHRAFSANQFQLPGHWPEAFCNRTTGWTGVAGHGL